MKSPFLIKQDLISPSLCEDIIDSLQYKDDIRLVIENALQTYFIEFEEHFSMNINLISNIHSVYLSSETDQIPKKSDSHIFKDGKWSRINDIDFTGVIFLSDYNDRIPFSDDYEVYGGKLEFKQHRFGFNPERGTLILFPSDPHFLYNFSTVKFNKGHYIKFNLTCQRNFVYKKEQFKGNYLTWFKEIA